MTKREFLNAIANAENLSAELIEYPRTSWRQWTP